MHIIGRCTLWLSPSLTRCHANFIFTICIVNHIDSNWIAWRTDIQAPTKNELNIGSVLNVYTSGGFISSDLVFGWCVFQINYSYYRFIGSVLECFYKTQPAQLQWAILLNADAWTDIRRTQSLHFAVHERSSWTEIEFHNWWYQMRLWNANVQGEKKRSNSKLKHSIGDLD